MTDDSDLGRPRTVWPMYLFVGGLVALGVVLTYVLLWRWFTQTDDGYGYGYHRGPGPYTYLICFAPFAAAAAAFRAIREQLRDDAQRAGQTRAERRAAKREKLAPRPAEPAPRVFEGDPFRAPPKVAPIVAKPVAQAAPTTAPLVAGDTPPPKLLN